MKKSDIYLLRVFFFIFFANWTFLFSFIPVYLREERGFSIGMIGLLSSLSSFSGALSQVYVGYLSDRMRKRKPFIWISLLLLSIIYLLIFPRLTSYLSFMVLYPILGILINSAITTSNVLVLDYSISESAGKYYASTRIWGSIGFLSLMLIIGLYPTLIEPKVMFLLISIIYMVGALIIFLVNEPSIKTHIKPVELGNAKKLVLRSEIRNFLLFYIIYYIALVGASSNVNLLIRYLGGTSRDISFAYSASSFSEIPFILIWGYLSDKIGRKPILLFSSIVLPIRVFLYTIANNPMDVILIQFMHSLTFAVIGTIPIVYINDFVLEEERATAQGLLSMAMSVSSIFGPLISGVIADILGLKGMYLFLTFVAINSAILGLKLKESMRKNT